MSLARSAARAAGSTTTTGQSRSKPDKSSTARTDLPLSQTPPGLFPLLRTSLCLRRPQLQPQRLEEGSLRPWDNCTPPAKPPSHSIWPGSKSVALRSSGLPSRSATNWPNSGHQGRQQQRRRELPVRVSVTPEVVVVEVDGGRLRTRSCDCGPGVHEAQNKEDKVACLVTLKSDVLASDPQPEPPPSFRELRVACVAVWQ